MTRTQVQFRPQPGPQEQFASCTADIGIYGGAAFGGKTFAELLEPLRNINNPKFSAVIFRREHVDVTNPGGLWDSAGEVYPLLGAQPRISDYLYEFKSGMRVMFAHLQHENDKHNWAGAQVPLFEFDELTHFTESQFWFILSRNRSLCGVRPYIRATCNPDPDSWVARLIDWWIGEDGFPIKERSGVVRYFVREGDTIRWADRAEDLPTEWIEGVEVGPKSLTFIPAKITDNKIGLKLDPTYMASLRALPLYERRLLLDGNWKVKRGGGIRFKRPWFKTIDALPAGAIRTLRYWDRAATEVTPQTPNPDWTAGVKLHLYANGRIVVSDVTRTRETPGGVRRTIVNTSTHDRCPHDCELWLEQDPAQAGKTEKMDLTRDLAEFAPRFAVPAGDKWTRSAPASVQSEQGNVELLRGAWNDAFLDELNGFQDPKSQEGKKQKDDQVDGFSGGVNELLKRGRPRIS